VVAHFQRGRKTLTPLSWYKALSDSRKRRECGFFLIEGRRAIEQITGISPQSIKELLLREGKTQPDVPGVERVRTLTHNQFDAIVSSRTPQGIAAVVEIPRQTYDPSLPDGAGERVLLLEHVQDPGNVGTLIRTAAAFGYDGVLLSDLCADPFSPKAVQATAGSLFSLWLRRTGEYASLTSELGRRGHALIAADVAGAPLGAPRELSGAHVLMLGNEGVGLSESLKKIATRSVRIPIDAHRAESLNVAVSGAILMYCGMKKNEDCRS
jgi:RNA methyltransferase, TrmH family